MKKHKVEHNHFTLMDEAERIMDLPTWFRVALNLKEILGPDLIQHIGWKYLKTGDYHWRLYHKGRHSLYQDHVNYVINYFSDKTGRLLDVGCGEGLILSLLNSQTELVCFGIDSSPLAIMFAHQRGVTNCECTDLFTYNESEYDFIFMGDVLEHLDHPDLALKKMKDLLVPNGILLISTPVQGDKPGCGDKYVLTVDKLLEMIGNELSIIYHETRQVWLKHYFLARKDQLDNVERRESNGINHVEGYPRQEAPVSKASETF